MYVIVPFGAFAPAVMTAQYKILNLEQTNVVHAN